MVGRASQLQSGRYSFFWRADRIMCTLYWLGARNFIYVYRNWTLLNSFDIYLKSRIKYLEYQGRYAFKCESFVFRCEVILTFPSVYGWYNKSLNHLKDFYLLTVPLTSAQTDHFLPNDVMKSPLPNRESIRE